MNKEPALILGAIAAIVSVAMGFGLHISDVQFGLIMAAVTAVMAVITRSQVTPNP